MSVNKTIKYLLPSTTIDMGGIPVKQALPTQKVQQLDPFLLLHHARAKFSDRRPAKQQGVGPHPHRGFAPVTFVIEGEVQHRDSWGNNQIAKEGEVQWMYSGAGIVHSERPTQALVEGAAAQETIQLWINNSSEFKKTPPKYIYLSENDMPVFSSADNKIKHKLVAGTYDNQKSAFHPQNEVLIIWSSAEKLGKEQFSLPKQHNCLLYLVKGAVSVKGFGKVEAEHLAILSEDGDSLEIETLEKDTQFILLCGQPIDEPVTQQGPFVMNTSTEVLEAMRDYRMGKMGILIED